MTAPSRSSASTAGLPWSGEDPGDDPEKWKEWLEKQRQAKDKAKPTEKGTDNKK